MCPVAVQADDFPLGRRRRGQVGLDPKGLLGRCPQLVDFCHGFSSVARLRLKATGAGSRPGLVHGRKVAVRHSGSCAPRWCFPPRFNHRLEQLAQRHHRTFGPSAARARCKHSRVPKGTLTKSSRFAQRRLLHDFIPSQIFTDAESHVRICGLIEPPRCSIAVLCLGAAQSSQQFDRRQVDRPPSFKSTIRSDETN